MSYFLPDNYKERPGAVQQVDRLRDEWQDEVYKEAAALAKDLDLYGVLDYGTGSGFKLIKYFTYLNCDVTGLDRQPAVDELREKYPTWFWSTPERYFAAPHFMPIDLVICADVIEHLDDPDALLESLKSLRPKWLVISTPDRSLPLCCKMGPPHNPQHVREWSFQEFRQYMDSHFQVVRHFHSNFKQATQCVVARLK